MGLLYIDPVVHYDIPATSITGMLNDMEKVLVSGTPNAGWSQTNTSAIRTLTFTGVPANGQTVTIDGKIYTYQTTLTDVNGNVFIGVDTAACADNLKSAINLDAGAGSKYAASTTLHPTVSATNPTTTQVQVIAKIAGPSGNGLAVSETINPGATWDGTETAGGGYKFTSGLASWGGRYKLWLRGNGTLLDLSVLTMDEAIESTIYRVIAPGGGQRRHIIADPLDVWFFKPGNNGTGGTEENTFHCSLLSLPTPMEPLVIIDASNTTPIRIKTSASHGLVTGNTVYITNVTGNTAANGNKTVTVFDADEFDLDGTVGNGAYTGGGLVGGGPTNRTSEVFFISGDLGGGADSFRGDISYIDGWGIRNGIFSLLLTSGGNAIGLDIEDRATPGSGWGEIKFASGRYLFYDPAVMWDEGLAGIRDIQGFLYNAAGASVVLPGDRFFQTPDNEWWTQFTFAPASFGTLCLRKPAVITTL